MSQTGLGGVKTQKARDRLEVFFISGENHPAEEIVRTQMRYKGKTVLPRWFASVFSDSQGHFRTHLRVRASPLRGLSRRSDDRP